MGVGGSVGGMGGSSVSGEGRGLGLGRAVATVAGVTAGGSVACCFGAHPANPSTNANATSQSVRLVTGHLPVVRRGDLAIAAPLSAASSGDEMLERGQMIPVLVEHFVDHLPNLGQR